MGVVPSQSDELEGRFPSGDANLSVNCLSILALETTAEAISLVPNTKASLIASRHKYLTAVASLRHRVHTHFSMSAPWRYAYFKGCPEARGWICLAATAGLPHGPEALRYALTTLWRQDTQALGVSTAATSSDVWDRCTLYAICSALQAREDEGLEQLGMARLQEFARKRLTGGRSAPYAIENQGSGAQLAAESALVVRVVTDGLLGLRPLAARRFVMCPVCPHSWPAYCVRAVCLAGVRLHFSVRAATSHLRRMLTIELTTEAGSTAVTVLAGSAISVQLGPRDEVPTCFVHPKNLSSAYS